MDRKATLAEDPLHRRRGPSGTTLLGNLLGRVPWSFVGQSHNLWKNRLINEGACGCGLKLRDCAVWQRAFDVAFGGIDTVDALRALSAEAHRGGNPNRFLAGPTRISVRAYPTLRFMATGGGRDA